MVSEELLKRHHARIVELAKGETLFEQGESATHFYLVRSGRIKMSSFNDEGREFVQGYFVEGQSFGEPPFFNQMPYPAASVAVEKSSVWKVSHDSFMILLRENFDVHLQLTRTLSGRLIYKSMMIAEIAVEEAEHRLTTLIEYFRDSDDAWSPGEPYQVPFTRQQLADMSGLRVETVIRSVKAMETKGALRIADGKVFWIGRNRSHTYRTYREGE